MRLVAIKSASPDPRSGERPSVYAVLGEDGHRIGLVVAERDWLGHRYGPRRWWAAWRQDGDQVARWHGVDGHPTRKAAVAELMAVVASGGVDD